MSKKLNTKHLIALCFLLVLFVGGSNAIVSAQTNKESVELNGDTVEYESEGQKINAKGNVKLVYRGAILTCDEVVFDRNTKIAEAKGNVRLVSDQGEIVGEKLTFNFETMQGDFNGTQIVSAPFYGSAKSVDRSNSEKMVMNQARISTCDYDKPHYHLGSKKMEIYPGDKIVANNVNMRIGKLPVLYIPRYVQSLKSGKPRVSFVPGFERDWGAFLLTKWRYEISDNLKGAINLDYREKLGFASGVDVSYDTKKFGEGIVKTYYTGERDKDNDPVRTIERFKAEWRHKWQIDDKTDAIWQYYKLSDAGFLKDYFEKEYDKDPNPDTFFLLTRRLPKGIFSFRTDARVNRFESKVERLPEIGYDLSNLKIGDTGLYYKNSSTFSNLTKKTPSPSEIRQKTMRMDMINEIAYPKKIGVVEFKPYVGSRHTYYSRTKDPDKYDTIRGLLNTGASLSTKFYRVYDVEMDKFGLKVDGLRHIMTPTVSYGYTSEPTRNKSDLDLFDAGIDDLDNSHSLNFAYENKLQTKRKGKTVDLLRAIISTDYRLKEDPRGGGFDDINSDIDFHPVDWLTFYFDSSYSTREEHLKTANIDMYINGGDKWSLGIGKRFNREVDDQITTDFNYQINKKWAFRAYERFDIATGIFKEQEYRLTRDLHAWEMELNLNMTRGGGTEMLVLFRLKAFPDLGFDVGTTINQREGGSQNQEGK